MIMITEYVAYASDQCELAEKPFLLLLLCSLLTDGDDAVVMRTKYAAAGGFCV